MVDTVLNVLQIFMGDWHAHFQQMIFDALLWVLEIVSQQRILLFELLPLRQLRILIVDLSQLLHLEVVLANQVLLLLCEVTQVAGGGSSKDLSTGHSVSILELSPSCQHSKALHS